jgi:hypothetical protein
MIANFKLWQIILFYFQKFDATKFQKSIKIIVKVIFFEGVSIFPLLEVSKYTSFWNLIFLFLTWPLLLMKIWASNLDYVIFPFICFGLLWIYPPDF